MVATSEYKLAATAHLIPVAAGPYGETCPKRGYIVRK